MSKNDTTIEFRLPVDQKQEFFFACNERGLTMSVVLKELIEEYIINHKNKSEDERKF